MPDDLQKKIDDYFANVSDEQFLADLKAAGFTLVPKMTPNEVEQRRCVCGKPSDGWPDDMSPDELAGRRPSPLRWFKTFTRRLLARLREQMGGDEQE